MFFRRLQITTKLVAFSLAAVVSSVALTAAVSLYEITHEANRQANVSLNQRLESLRYMLKRHGDTFSIVDNKLTIGDFVVDNSFEEVDRIKAIFGGTATVFKMDERVSTNVVTDNGSRAVGTRLKGIAYDSIFKEKKPYRGEASILGIPYYTAYDPIFDEKNEVIGILYAGVKKDVYLKSYKNIQYQIGIVAFILVMAFGTVIFISVKKITRRIIDVVTLFSEMEKGNFTMSIDSHKEDTSEVGRLLTSLAQFEQVMRSTIKNIGGVALQLSASTDELSQASENFSGNAQNQAASAEEITSTIEEISAGMDNVARSAEYQMESMNSLSNRMGQLSGIIHEMAEKVRSSQNIANDISLNAEKGGASIREISNSMIKIDGSSKEVTNIVKIITDISEQINLLSLNAAIEAARAGEAGRGFAVVADEISKLADRTAASIKEIDNLIKTNEQEIEKGSITVEESVTMIGSIIQGIESVAGAMDDISGYMNRQIESNEMVNKEADIVKERSEEIRVATEQQKTAVNEIVRSISNINDLTQSIASGSEEMTGNIEELVAMAENLKNKMESFKV